MSTAAGPSWSTARVLGTSSGSPGQVPAARSGSSRTLQLEARLHAMIDAWFAHVEQHPYIWRLLFRDTTGDPDVQALHVELQRRQRAADVALLREFAPGIPEIELEPLGEAMRSSLYGLALWWLDRPDTGRDVLVATMLRLTRGVLLTVDRR